MQDSQAEHIFKVNFTKTYFSFMKVQLKNRMQLSVYWQTGSPC